MTVLDFGPLAEVFVSNVLSGTVTRLDLAVPRPDGHIRVLDERQIASSYAHRPDPAALVVGPTGLALDARHDVLYVASTADNEIFAVPNASHRTKDAGTGKVVVKDDKHLRGPLGLVLAPNGDLVTTNGDAVNGDPTQRSEIVEYSHAGTFVTQRSVDTGGQGGAFGIALDVLDDTLRFAAVDDVTNVLDVWNLT